MAPVLGEQDLYSSILQRFSHQLSHTKTLGELIQHIAEAVAQALQPNGLALVVRRGNVFVVESCSQVNLTTGRRYTLTHPVVTWLSQHRRPLNVVDEMTWLASLDLAEQHSIKQSQVSIFIPLFNNEQLNGWLGLGAPDGRPAYSLGEQIFLTTLSDQASVALEVTHLVYELQQRVDQLSVLNETSQVLTSSLRTEALLEKIQQQVSRLMDASNLCIAMYERETGSVHFPLSLLDGRPRHIPDRQAGKGLTEYVLHTKRPVLIKCEEDKRAIAQDTHYPGFQEIGRPARSWLGVPMTANEQSIGAITVQNFEQEAVYTEDDLEILCILASQAAIAITNARLYEQTDLALNRRVDEVSTRNRQLSEILHLGNALKANLDLEQISQQVVQAVRNSLGFNIAVISMLHDKPFPHLQPLAGAGIPAQQWETMRQVEVSQDILSRLMCNDFRLSQSYFVRGTYTSYVDRLTFHSSAERDMTDAPKQDPRPSNPPPSTLTWLPGDALFVPLTNTDGKLQGLLSVEDPLDKRIPTQETLEVLEVFANQASIAIENARLFRERLRQINHLSQLYQSSMTLAFSTQTHEVLKHIGEIAGDITASDSIAIYRYQPSSGAFTLDTALGHPLPYDSGNQIRPNGMTHRTITERRSFIVADTDLEPNINPTVRQAGIRSLICMPLISKGHALGVIYVNSTQANKYSDDDVQLISALAGQAAIAIENGDLFKRLAEGRDRLRVVLDSTREGIMMLDTEGRIVFTNTMFGELFDTSPASLTGRKLLNVMAQHPEQLDDTHTTMMDIIYETLGELAQQNQAITKSDISLTHPPRFIERVSLPVFGETGLAIGRLLTLRDITEEKKAEALREDLMNMMVHDLRSPLTTILGGLQVLEFKLKDEYDLRAVRVALSGSNRLLDLINALLDISKMEAGQMPLNRQTLSWEQLVNEAMDRVTPLADREKISIQSQLAAHLPSIDADEVLLVRVLTNLLDNAIKYSPPNSAINLSVTSNMTPDGQLETLCRVSDHGPGIRLEHQQMIFEKFFQAPTSTEKRKGSGLGLAFCRLAIEAHKGRIWVESTPGQGSTFVFTLPADATYKPG